MIFCLSGRNIIFGQAEDVNQKVEKNIRIYAGKEKTSSEEKKKSFEELNKLGDKAIPKLEELSDSQDEDIRHTAINSILQIQGKSEKIFIKAINDKSFKVQIIPLLWLKVKEKKDEKDEEYKTWKEKLKNDFNEVKFKELAEIVEQNKGNWKKSIYIGEQGKKFDGWYASVYLIEMGDKSFPLIKKELEKNVKSPLWPVFSEIVLKHPEEKYGLTFLIELLNNKIKELKNVGKNEKEIGRELAIVSSYIDTIISAHPEVVEFNDIKQLQQIIEPMKNKNSILECKTSNNLYTIIEDSLKKLNKDK